jgi:hypothetical protein
MIDDVLSAARPNAATVAALDPQLLADIAGVPIAATRFNHLQQSIFQIALTIGVIEPPRRELTLRDLQEIATADERAHVVLAAIGRPINPWSRMNRQERAALLLGKIVRAKRKRKMQKGTAPPSRPPRRWSSGRRHDQIRSRQG